MSNPEYSLSEPTKETTPTEKSKVDKVPTSVTKPDKSSEDTSGAPMGVEHFGVKGWSEILLTPALDSNKIVDKIVYIEDYVKNSIKNEGLKLTQSVYSKIITDMESELGLSGSHEPEVRINKIYNLIKFIERAVSEREKNNRIIMLLNNHS